MNAENKKYSSLLVWIGALYLIGSVIGYSTKTEVNTWYSLLHHSALKPPNIVFGIVWPILYIIIALCGWMIWQQHPFSKLMLIKKLYIIQLLLNWSWTPLFFHYHLTSVSLSCLVLMDLAVAGIIYFSAKKIRLVSYFMIPYLIWILFATYLNYFIWRYN